MNPHSAKIVVTNDRKNSQVLYIEPWGEDYTLRASESMDIVAFGTAALPWFNIVESDRATQIYIENCTDFVVYQNGEEVHCGHNRGR